MGFIISSQLLIVSAFTVKANHAKINPIDTIIRGATFSEIGKINIDVLIGGVHDIALPATMDKDDRATIGLIILMLSSILTKDGPA